MISPENRPNLHLCDFDGTLYRRDSLWQFLFFYWKKQTAPLRASLAVRGLVALPFYTLFKGKSAAKAALLSVFFKGKSQVYLLNEGKEFAKSPALQLHLRTDLLHRLLEEKKSGNTVVILSASLDWWLQPISELWGFQLICTKAAYSPLPINETTGPSTDAAFLALFTGHFDGKNCKGLEKVHRAEQEFDRAAFHTVYAYGDSPSDAAILAWADVGVKRFGG